MPAGRSVPCWAGLDPARARGWLKQLCQGALQLDRAKPASGGSAPAGQAQGPCSVGSPAPLTHARKTLHPTTPHHPSMATGVPTWKARQYPACQALWAAPPTLPRPWPWRDTTCWGRVAARRLCCWRPLGSMPPRCCARSTRRGATCCRRVKGGQGGCVPPRRILAAVCSCFHVQSLGNRKRSLRHKHTGSPYEERLEATFWGLTSTGEVVRPPQEVVAPFTLGPLLAGPVDSALNLSYAIEDGVAALLAKSSYGAVHLGGRKMEGGCFIWQGAQSLLLFIV